MIQSVNIPREAGGHPVEDHTDPRLVQLIDKIHEVLRRSVARRRRIVAKRLVAPRFIQRMLHHRHELYMGIAHLPHKRNQLVGNAAEIGIQLPFLRCRKGTGIELIDTDRHISQLQLCTPAQELRVLPVKFIQIGNDRCRIRSELRGITIRICLEIGQTVLQLYFKFIVLPDLSTGNKNFKNTGIPEPAHLVNPAVPAVEISYHADTERMRRPHGEIGSPYAIHRHGMRPKLFIDGIMNPILE